MEKVLLTLVLLIAGSGTGYILQRLISSGRLIPSIPVRVIQRRLQKVVILGFSPVAAIGAIWAIPIRSSGVAALPLLGVSALAVGGIAAWLLAGAARLPAYRKGAFVVCGSITNLGAIGSLVVFLLLGEQGYALVPFYKLFELIIYFGIVFPIARHYAGGQNSPGESPVRRVVRDPFIMVSLAGILTGSLLNWSGIERPGWYGELISILVPVNTFLLLVSIGLALRFGRMRPYLGTGALIMLIKFILVPAVIVTLALIAGFDRLYDGLPLKVVLILAAMPVGFIATIPPALYGLDIDLANTAWIMTTSGLVVVVPILWYLVGIL